MTISAVNGNGSSISALFHQRRADFKAMSQDVQSGNISAAATALQAYQQDAQNIQSQLGASNSGSSSGSPYSSKFQNDIASLTSAIQSGSIASAQTALQAYQQDRTDGEQSVFPGAPTATSGAGPAAFGNDLTKLLQDSVQGNISAAQADAASLVKDLQGATSGAPATSTTTPAADGAGQTQPAGGHHHHHHHGGGGSEAPNNVAQNSLLSGLGGNSNGTNGAGSASNSSPNGLLASLFSQFESIISPTTTSTSAT